LCNGRYDDPDIEALIRTPGVLGTIRAIAMAREGEVQYYAKVAHENIEQFQAASGHDGGSDGEPARIVDRHH
jgi:hypothetical protein